MRNPVLRPHRRLVGLTALVTATYGHAAPERLMTVDQRGDFVLFGNTLGWDCSAATPSLASGTTLSCANTTNTGDSAIDIYWRSEDDGTCRAASTVNMADARSTAELVLPTGATITHARLYWAAMLPDGSTRDDSAVIDRPGVPSSARAVTADRCWSSFVQGTSGKFFYQCAADITSWMGSLGAGAFRVGGVTAVNTLPTYNDSNTMAGWFAVVFYSLATDPPRNLTLFEGLDSAYDTNPQTATLNGFLVPAVFDAKVGVVAYEGDSDANGDSISLGPNAGSLTALTNALNPANNFFNSSRTYLGAGVSNALDLPRLPGTADTMGGVDMDVVDVRSLMQPNQTTATIRVTSSGEHIALGALVTSISTFKPDFSTSGKSVSDVNGGALLPGDVLEYTIVVTNTGSDTSTNTVMTDALPTQVTYVPGSLSVVQPTAIPLTDATGDDVGQYVAATRTITVRLGTGANATAGGTMTVGASTTLRFRVTVNSDASGTIANQAIITAAGAQGAPASDYPTDGNGAGSGSPPTTIGMDSDADGIPDTLEATYGTNPKDADSDDDGVLDGAEPSPGTDSDSDGLVNGLDPDSDNDGLFDGTELGFGCSNAATSLAAGRCIPDMDAGATRTDPLVADTDGGGRRDGSEDANLNGRVDAGETDPTTGHGSDDSTMTDTDADGLSDALENRLGSKPNDKDSDDDGVLDGLEPNPSDDGDRDGLVDVVDSDSDDDGLFDGTELGYDCSNTATDPNAEQCVADANPATRTSAIDPDSDDGGVRDGSEDVNGNGALDPSETDPTAGHGADDGDALNLDSDGDGLPNRVETELGSGVNDRDSDDDGVPDGEEANLAADTDGDNLINVLDPDSDGDGLFDGTELGYACAGTDTTAHVPPTCIADADTTTWTSPLARDTDRGGRTDGAEDANHNGRVDSNERDPLNATDDSWGCLLDAECGATTSGRVCSAGHACVDGCRGVGGNGCPSGQTCSSTTSAIGTCTVVSGAGGAAGAAGAGPVATGGSPTAGAAGSAGAVVGMGGMAIAGTPVVAGTAGVITAGAAGSISAGAAGQPAAGQAGSNVAGAAGAVAAAGTAGVAGAVIAGASGNTAGAENAGAAGFAGGQASGGTSPGEGGSTAAEGGSATGGSATGVAGTGRGGVGALNDDLSLEGAGCDCSVAGSKSNGGAWLLAMVAGLLGLRRKRSN